MVLYKAGFGKCALVPVSWGSGISNIHDIAFLLPEKHCSAQGNTSGEGRFGTGEHLQKPPFWKPPLCEPPRVKMLQMGGVVKGGCVATPKPPKVCCHACFSRATVCCHWGWEDNPPPPTSQYSERVIGDWYDWTNRAPHDGS